MEKSITKVLIIFTMIALIGVALNSMFGVAGDYSPISFITKEQIGETSLYWFKYDFHSYTSNISNTFSNFSILSLEFPKTEWQNTTASIVEDEFWAVLLNDLSYIFNWIIFGINILLYPLRIGGYLLLNLLSIVGLNTQEIILNNQAEGLGWLVLLAKVLAEFQIPFIPA